MDEKSKNEKEVEKKKPVEERSPSPIKSIAAVKHTAYIVPRSYIHLKCNTDLNLPPSNWENTIDSYGLKRILPRSGGLSSFRMAHMFPDSVGQVDVIAGAECIKKLLKLPYQPTGTVSMMVHRVENTLLLDDFNIYDYLMKSEWSWLKDFFYENILKTMSEQERMSVMLPAHATTSMQLTHKFLSHSVAELSEPDHEQELPAVTRPCISDSATTPKLPEPETRSEQPTSGAQYIRNVHWIFENIQMLIGSDLVIFGDKEQPCVSLRLHDSREPINVLTGIDCWLDNLMCNVPEVIMCFHLDGIVQKYEPIKTEDLPNMENSSFSPKIIRNVAQNILSFLKLNVTKAGHTYWLFKGPHDDVVKLYDLTSLCPDGLDNPFITPVAMLLYRVARNIKLSNRSKHVKQLLEHAIKLLDVERYPQIAASSHYMLADLYVPATTNPASPDFKDESSDSDMEEDADYECPRGADRGRGGGSQEEEEVASSLAVQIRGLALHDIGDPARDNRGDQKSKAREGKGLGVEPSDRCEKALHHAFKGLQALHHILIDKNKEKEREHLKRQIIVEEQHPKMANPYEPIKMNYEPINKKKDKQQPLRETKGKKRKKNRKQSEKSENCLIESTSNVDKNAILAHKEKNVLPFWNEPSRDDNFAWKLHLKTLLYEKMCIVFATLAEYNYAKENYGNSLKYIYMASRCQKLLNNMIIKSTVIDVSCLIGRVGDNFYQLSKHWSDMEKFKEQFVTDHEIDILIKVELEKDMTEEAKGAENGEFDLDITLPESELQALISSCEYYRRAMERRAGEGAGEGAGRREELLRRLASVTNDLGVRYMNEFQITYVKYSNEEDQKDPKVKQLLKKVMDLSKQSEDCLQEAINIFKQVNDVPNLALLYCNMGKLIRFKAHCNLKASIAEKREMFNRAEEKYKCALRQLGPRESCGAAAVWDTAAWELSSHVFTRAVLYQQHPDLYGSNSSEVADAFKNALKHCQLSPGPRQHTYQFRAAMIYHRLASLYHSQYRETEEEGMKRRNLLNATREHYEKATNMFAILEEPVMFLTVQMEHVGLMEFQAEVSPNLKLKSLQTVLQLLRQCQSIMKLFKVMDPEEKETKTEDQDERNFESVYGLLSLYESRLHFTLKSIIQYCRSKCNKDYEKMSDMYKKLYCASLKIQKTKDIRIYASSICDVLMSMENTYKDFE